MEMTEQMRADLKQAIDIGIAVGLYGNRTDKLAYVETQVAAGDSADEWLTYLRGEVRDYVRNFKARNRIITSSKNLQKVKQESTYFTLQAKSKISDSEWAELKTFFETADLPETPVIIDGGAITVTNPKTLLEFYGTLPNEPPPANFSKYLILKKLKNQLQKRQKEEEEIEP